MKILSLCAFLMLSSAAFGQGVVGTAEKAPTAVDEALRARVNQFYQAFVTGKFRDAYVLVSPDSQDAFLEGAKDQYTSCETVKISYTDNFTKASVVESCKMEWRLHGTTIPNSPTFTTNWKIVDGQWCWYYVRPEYTQSPFSPTGWVKVPPAESTTDSSHVRQPVIPKDPKAAALDILGQVKVDKTDVLLHAYESSKDEIHIRNEMPGTIMLAVEVPPQPGLKVLFPKTELNRNEEMVMTFEYRLDDATIACGECAKRVHESVTVLLRIIPTGRIFPITVSFKPEPSKPLSIQK